MFNYNEETIALYSETMTGAKFNSTCLTKEQAAAANITIYLSTEYNNSRLDYYVEPVTEYWE